MGDRAYGIFNNSSRFDKFGRLKIGNNLIKSEYAETTTKDEEVDEDKIIKEEEEDYDSWI